MYLGAVHSRSTAYRKVTNKHNHLNRKNIIQNQKYKCKNKIKFIYLTFVHCTCKFEKHKQSLLSENYEPTFPNKKQKQSFPSENYNRMFHNINVIEKLSGCQYFKKDSADEVSVIRMCLIRNLTSCSLQSFDEC